jgi:hypothetical protein
MPPNSNNDYKNQAATTARVKGNGDKVKKGNGNDGNNGNNSDDGNNGNNGNNGGNDTKQRRCHQW